MREVQHCGWPAATVAGDLSDDASSWGDSVLVEAHVFGDVLTGPDTVDVICLALVVDLPVDEVSWLARPAPAEAAASLLRFEWETSRRHLEHVVDSYHDRSWRRDHKGFGVYPEDHLWWATRGWLELDDALRAIDRPDQPA